MKNILNTIVSLCLLILIGSERCGFCVEQKKILDGMGVSYTYYDIDTENGQRIAKFVGVQGIPHMVHKDKEHVGLMKEDEVREFIK